MERETYEAEGGENKVENKYFRKISSQTDKQKTLNNNDNKKKKVG